MVIIDSMVTDQVIQDELQAIESTITASGEIVKVDKWGKRKMAYEIDKKSHGFYAVFYYNSEAEVVDKLERGFRINDNVIRWITIADQPMPTDFVGDKVETAEETTVVAAQEETSTEAQEA